MYIKFKNLICLIKNLLVVGQTKVYANKVEGIIMGATPKTVAVRFASLASVDAH